MECSSLAACSEFRNIIFGQILFTADTLADIHNYDERGWGGDSFEIALSLCLDAVININKTIIYNRALLIWVFKLINSNLFQL